MSALNHTPEPWTVDQSAGGFEICNDETLFTVAAVRGSGPLSAANAARIVGCVNFCAEVSAERLTEDSLVEVLADRDRLIDALSAMQRNPNDPSAHRRALDVLQGRA